MSGKEKISPKVGRSAVRRGTNRGAVRTHNKKRSTGLASMAAGDDLLTQVRADRAKQQTDAQVTSRPVQPKLTTVEIEALTTKVLDLAGPELVTLAKSQNWSDDDRKAACEYLKLLSGARQGTVSINDEVAAKVRHVFTTATLDARVPWRTLPGQLHSQYRKLSQDLLAQRRARRGGKRESQSAA